MTIDTKAPPAAGVVTVTRSRRRTAPPWWFVVPAMVLFAFVVLVPSARGVYYAFTDWDGLDPQFSFVGLRNFTDMLNDPTALQAIWHTILIAVAISPDSREAPQSHDRMKRFNQEGTRDS